MLTLTLADRAEAYRAAFSQFPDSVPVVSPTGRWLTAMWLLGNAYAGSGFYGSYPPSYVRRVRALFPDVPPERWVHLFSGSLADTVGGIRIDVRAPGTGVVAPSCRADATALPFLDARCRLIAADPPYSRSDAARYGTRPVDKRRVLRECARVLEPGGHLIWLDTTLPLYRKTDWHLWGLITVQRSTNHRTRLCSLFTRK